MDIRSRTLIVDSSSTAGTRSWSGIAGFRNFVDVLQLREARELESGSETLELESGSDSETRDPESESESGNEAGNGSDGGYGSEAGACIEMESDVSCERESDACGERESDACGKTESDACDVGTASVSEALDSMLQEEDISEQASVKSGLNEIPEYSKTYLYSRSAVECCLNGTDFQQATTTMEKLPFHIRMSCCWRHRG